MESFTSDQIIDQHLQQQRMASTSVGEIGAEPADTIPAAKSSSGSITGKY